MMMQLSDQSPIIEAKNLVKRYDGFTAVNGIDFTVQSGECFGFLGPNGAGKTTTMRMIYRSTYVTQGELRVLGINAHETKHDRHIKSQIGVVPQETNLDPELTVRETCLVFARFYGLYGEKAEEQTEKFLRFVGLADRAHKRIETLSGGMKRRALIARALIADPKLLILDEPTTGLDPQARHRLWKQLRQLKAQGRTIVLTTHYMEEAQMLCDRVAIMDLGKIVASGSPNELIKTHVTSDMAGLEVEEAAMPTSPLEQVFLKITKDRFEDD